MIRDLRETPVLRGKKVSQDHEDYRVLLELKVSVENEECEDLLDQLVRKVKEDRVEQRVCQVQTVQLDRKGN